MVRVRSRLSCTALVTSCRTRRSRRCPSASASCDDSSSTLAIGRSSTSASTSADHVIGGGRRNMSSPGEHTGGVVRREPSILHIDLDAMFAAVEQRDKVSLRGRPVIVGGVAGRGVVATASYEARAYGARSAMPTAEARRRCPPGTAFLAPRFGAYRRTSEVFLGLLAEVSPAVEQVSIDEAFIDLAAGRHRDLSASGVTA